MIGTNEMLLNQATIIEAVQYYFDKVLFAEGKSPKVISVKFDNNENYSRKELFTISISVPPIDQ